MLLIIRLIWRYLNGAVRQMRCSIPDLLDQFYSTLCKSQIDIDVMVNINANLLFNTVNLRSQTLIVHTAKSGYFPPSRNVKWGTIGIIQHLVTLSYTRSQCAPDECIALWGSKFAQCPSVYSLAGDLVLFGYLFKGSSSDISL